MTEKNFRSPQGGEFKKYWDSYIPILTSKGKFDKAHLNILSILCELHVEYNKLTVDIQANGYFYESEGRYGAQQHPRCEVTIRQKILSEIRGHIKTLGLNLNSSTRDDSPVDDDAAGAWL